MSVPLPPSGSLKTQPSKGAGLALTAALLGWMFDGAEMSIFALVGRPAVRDLLNTNDEGQIGLWFGVIMATFLVGAATGGVLFGWLGDRIGRVKAMTLSIFTYAVFTGLCGFASEAWQVGVLRFIAALGMGGEWSLGVALVMEVWPDRSRAFMAGLIGAAANVGFLLVGFVGLGLNAFLGQVQPTLISWGVPTETADMLVAHQGWRLMMMLGALPAILTFFVRMFVPESERWVHEKAKGATSHWATSDLLGVLIGATGPALIILLLAVPYSLSFDFANSQPYVTVTLVNQSYPWYVQLVGTIIGLVIATVGYLYPVRRYLSRLNSSGVATSLSEDRFTINRMLLGAGLSGVSLLGTWGSVQWAPSWAITLAKGTEYTNAKEYTQIALAIGAIAGTIAAAMAGDWIGRRNTYRLMCLSSIVSSYLLYLTNSVFGPWYLFCSLLAGFCTATFYGWLPLYLPELFRTHVRATGQGFGFNFGRILAAIGAMNTGVMMTQFQQGLTVGDYTIQDPQAAACSVTSLIYLFGLILIQFAPETKGKPLPD